MRMLAAIGGGLRAGLAAALVVMVRTYQWTISPVLAGVFGIQCRFRPTCSEYFIGAVRKYGPLAGAWRGACRVARCHPWREGGFDPP